MLTLLLQRMRDRRTEPPDSQFLSKRDFLFLLWQDAFERIPHGDESVSAVHPTGGAESSFRIQKTSLTKAADSMKKTTHPTANRSIIHTIFSTLVHGATIVIVLLLASAAQAAPWHGVTPLKSDKKAVHALLGKPTVETEDRMEFAHREGKVVVFFYTAADTEELKLLPGLAGKVLTLYFYPKRSREYDRAALTKRGCRIGRGLTIEGEPMTSYDDNKRGISFHFLGDTSKLWRMVYYAPAQEFVKYKAKQSD